MRPDSQAVLDALSELSNDSELDARWQLAAYGIDFILRQCGIAVSDRVDALNRARDLWLRRLAGDETLVKRFLNRRYRIHRQVVERTLSGREESVFPALKKLTKFQDATQPLFNRITAAALRRRHEYAGIWR